MATTALGTDPMPSQSLDLGFLDSFDISMPETMEEMVPVDRFVHEPPHCAAPKHRRAAHRTAAFTCLKSPFSLG